MMEVLRCEQRTEEWYRARLGIPTASAFSAVLSGGRGAEAAAHRRRYMYRLAGERMTGRSDHAFENRHTKRGRALEPEAIAAYEMQRNTDVDKVGLILNHGAGASPDGLVGPEGLVEVKCALPELLIPYLLGEAEPTEHKAQIQGQMYVAEREWADLIVYAPGMPPYVRRYDRDEPYIRHLSAAIARFLAELESLVEVLRDYGRPTYNPGARVPDVTDLGMTAEPPF